MAFYQVFADKTAFVSHNNTVCGAIRNEFEVQLHAERRANCAG